MSYPAGKRAMKTAPRLAIPVLLGFLLVAVGCRDNSASSMPLADGQYLTYRVALSAIDENGTPPEASFRYEFKSLDNELWQVTGRSVHSGGSGVDFTFDKNAMLHSTSAPEPHKWKIGRRLSILWLAPRDRHDGKIIVPYDEMDFHKVGAEADWQKWRVFPAVSASTDKKNIMYYEKTTGWLVGREMVNTQRGYKRIDVLSDTNIDIPAQ